MAFTQRPTRTQPGSSNHNHATPSSQNTSSKTDAKERGNQAAQSQAAQSQGGLSFQDALLSQSSSESSTSRSQDSRSQNPESKNATFKESGSSKTSVTPEWRQSRESNQSSNRQGYARSPQNNQGSTASQSTSTSSNGVGSTGHSKNKYNNRNHSNQSSPQTKTSSNQPVTANQRAQWMKEKEERQAQWAKEKAERQARFEKRKKIADELAQIKLDLVFEAIGNVQGMDVYSNQDGDASKWKIASKGNIITKGQSWQNTMTYKKGFGGVSLVGMALDLDWNQSIDWMIERFGEDLDESMKVDLEDIQKEEVILFAPPDANDISTGLARKYLINERGLPPSLIDREIKKSASGANGGLYGAHPLGNKEEPILSRHNIIFRGPASAEVRGIEGSNFKGCLGGSLPEHSGYRVTHSGIGEPIIAMTEAAIDALSYHALFPGRFVVSTNGSGSRFPLQYKLAVEMVNRDYGIRAAFDADAAGDFPAQRLCNAFILRKILMHKLQVDEDQVDEWFLDETIEFLPSESPHENCFNLGWKPLMPKYEFKLVHSEEDGRMHPTWIDTGEMATPCMRISIKRDLHPDWKRTSEKVIQIGDRAFGYIMNDLNLRRDRPLMTKDWNEELKELGPHYIQQYEQCAKHNFQTLPELPPELKQLREETTWVFTSPPPTSSFQPKR